MNVAERYSTILGEDVDPAATADREFMERAMPRLYADRDGTTIGSVYLHFDACRTCHRYETVAELVAKGSPAQIAHLRQIIETKAAKYGLAL